MATKLERNDRYNRILIIALAILLNLYYILPNLLSYSLELTILVCSIMINKSNIAERKVLFWTCIFTFYTLCIVLFRDNSFIYFTSVLNCFTICIIVNSLIRNTIYIYLFIISFAISGILFSLYVYYLFDDVLFSGRRIGNSVELDGYFGSAISIAYSLLIITLMQIWCIMNTTKIIKILSLIGVSINTILIIFTGTRKALLLPIIFVILLLIISYKQKPMKLLKYFFAIFIICFSLYTFIMNNEIAYDVIGNRMEGLFALFDDKYQIDDSTFIRLQLIDKAKVLERDNFFTGIGFSQTIALLGTHPHNNYHSLLCFGGLFYFISYYWIFITNLTNYTTRKLYNYKIGILLFSLFCVLVFSDMSTTSYNIIYFSLAISLISIYPKIQYNENRSN